MLRERWQQLMTIAVVVTLVVAVVALGVGIDALHKTKTATTPKTGGPATTITAPQTGQLVSGKVGLDVVAVAANVTAVDFLASGGALHNTKIASARRSLIGWLAEWNTSSVPNGTYQLVSVGYNRNGRSVRSPDVIIKVENF